MSTPVTPIRSGPIAAASDRAGPVAVTPTRSGQRASLTTSARSFPILRDVKISSQEQMETFVQLGQYNANIGKVVLDLTIQLPHHNGYPAQALRAVLQLTPNIECLVLDLPVEAPMNLLNGLHFPDLRIFSTNLPHRILTTFLTTHTSLTSLLLRTCGRSAYCPLRGLTLRHLSDLQCPSRCFVGIARGPLVTATVNLTRLTSMSTLAIQTLSSSRLHTLTVGCFINDYDILTRVAVAVPNLRKLKLNEKPHPQRRHTLARRPWNDLRSWHHTLMSLRSLEEFMLRTLSNVSSPTRSEANVVNGWARGVGHHAAAHPSLYYIALMQLETGPDATGQRLSHWFKGNTGGWSRLNSQLIGRNASFTL